MDSTKGFVTIVSGLPRSGTSMMMRMLEAGGMPVLIDNIRTADPDNPRGYYEFEAVKQTKSDPSWLDSAPGKAVKMVYRLLYDLPNTYEYRVLFMRRNLDEVLASQRVMLERSGEAGADVTDEQIANLFRSQLEKFEVWVQSQSNFKILEVNYNDMLADPQRHLKDANAFLDSVLDTQAMSAVIDPALYRNRK